MAIDREEFMRQVRMALCLQRPEVCAAFAARIALRMLPLIAQDRSLRRWSEGVGTTHLLDVVRAIIAAVALGEGISVEKNLLRRIRDNVFEARKSANDAYAAAAADVAGAAYYAVADEADATYQSDAADAANAAYTAYTYAAAEADADASIMVPIKTDIQNVKLKNNLTRKFLFCNPDDKQTPQYFVEFRQKLIMLNSDFDIWLDYLDKLIAGNPPPAAEQLIWISYPEEIAAQGISKLKAYILAQLSGAAKQPLNQIRAIFMGYGKTGKTSIIRALHGEEVQQDEDMTPGVAIREWDGAGNGLKTIFWDFGGQVMAHATHQFFLRSSCVYVVVVAARDSKNVSVDAEYWLQHVRAFGNDAPVLLVGNKSDEDKILFEQISLKDKFPNIVGFYVIASKHYEEPQYAAEFASFRHALCEQLRAQSLHQMLFTQQQFDALLAVKACAAQQNFLAHSAFFELCAKHGIGDEGEQNREWLLDTLDKLGIVIYFPKLPWMKEFVLNPRWLTWGVYTLIYDQQAQLDEEAIARILNGKEMVDEQGRRLHFDLEKARFIADAMMAFQLCYRLDGRDGKLMIPSAMPLELTADLQRNAFDRVNMRAYRMRFEVFVPRHLLPELIVRCNREIVGQNVCQKAVLLEKDGCQALIEVDYQVRELFILLKGKGANEYLAELRYMLRDILSRIKLQYEEELRLPAEAGMRAIPGGEWADFAVLTNMRRNGDNIYTSKYHRYDISALMDMYYSKQERASIVVMPGGVYNDLKGGHMGDKITNSNNSNIAGNIGNGNAGGNNNVAGDQNQIGSVADFHAALQALLAEIKNLNDKIPAPLAEHHKTLQAHATLIETEIAKPTPKPSFFGFTLDGVIDVATKLEKLGAPVLKAAQLAQQYLPALAAAFS